jgi:4-hydroxythreonine-4-phosphate dehydrogenase
VSVPRRNAGRQIGSIRRIKEAAEASYEPGTIDCIDLDLIPADLPFGQLSAVAGDAAYRFIARAVEIAEAKQISRSIS